MVPQEKKKAVNFSTLKELCFLNTHEDLDLVSKHL